jgi:hypothetical protein
MKMKINKSLYLMSLLTLASVACQPDEFEGDGNGLVGPDLDPSFTIESVPVEGKTNNFQFKLNSTTDDVLAIFWDLGSDTYIRGSENTEVLFYPDQDVYPIKLKIVGRGGESFISEQELVIETSDPKYGNLLSGARFKEGDDDQWGTLTYSGGVLPQFTGGKVVFDYGGWSHSGFYQSFEAVAGQKYRVDMLVSGAGATNMWFEVYIGESDPATFVGDYNEGGIRLALNTWAGCGNTKFAGNLTDLACDGSLKGDANGVFEVPSTGTYYLVVRTGGENLGTGGILVDDIEVRPYFDEE